MIFVFCRRNSEGARDLTEEFIRTGAEAGCIKTLFYKDFREDDILINWGDYIPEDFMHRCGDAMLVINSTLCYNKYRELSILDRNGVPVPPFSINKRGSDWLARRTSHTQANDLRANLRAGHYYVKYVPTVREYRAHVINGEVVRIGIKLPKEEGYDRKFRTHTAGWKIDYYKVPKDETVYSAKRVSLAAVRALQYDFGAVDVGVTETDAPIVFEVNSAPGMDTGTVRVYACSFLQIIKNYKKSINEHTSESIIE